MRRGLHFTIKRQRLIIVRLHQRSLDFNSLEDYLLQSSLFEEYDENQYSVRTLQRDIQDIKELYGIIILNERRVKKGLGLYDTKYFIDYCPENYKFMLKP